MTDPADLAGLGLSLAIGLLIGLERGWRARQLPEGRRVAGLRTFGLLGLMGGICAILGRTYGGWVVASGVLAIAAFLAVTYWVYSRSTRDFGATTEVAGLIAFGLGALAASGRPVLAAAAAVVTTILLGAKPVMHRWLLGLRTEELRAALQLLLLLVVVLPVLPNCGYGPHAALNPFRIVAMVGLISALTFGAYIAMRVVGARFGLLATGLLGGLVSSTAVTITLSRRARSQPELAPLLAAAVLASCSTMFVRTLVQAVAVHGALLSQLLPPLLGGTTLCAASAWFSWRRQARAGALALAPGRNPMEIWAAVQFSLLLAGIGLAVRALHARWGDAGIYSGAAIAGVADVDAITLTLSGLAAEGVPAAVAARGIVLAAVVNTLVKAGLALWIGGVACGRACALPLCAGAAGTWLVHLAWPAGA